MKIEGDDLRVVDRGQFVYLGPMGVAEYSLPEEDQELFAATLEGVGEARLSSLGAALVSWREHREPDRVVNVALADDPEEGFEPHVDPIGPSVLLLVGDRLLIQTWADLKVPSARAATHRLLSPLLRRHRASCVEVGLEQHGTLAIEWPTRGRTVADAWEFHRELTTLLSAARGGELSPTTALDLLRAGRGDLLRGQPESAWLEVKAEPYDLKDPTVKFELAKDVAAMANSRRGGIVVIGMSTEKKGRRQGEVDLIGDYSKTSLKSLKRQQYRSLVAKWVYPSLVGFEIERMEGSTAGEEVAVLVIPAQPEAKRPFLVQGTVDDGNVLGSHVLLPWRREDETDAMDVVAIHDRIRLGERAIAGGEVPPLG